MTAKTASANTCRRCGHPSRTAGPYGGGCARRVDRAVRVLRASGNRTAIKAAFLLSAGALHPTSHKGTWTVRSEANASLVYIVTTETCSCPQGSPQSDPCKHRAAAIILAEEVPS